MSILFNILFSKCQFKTGTQFIFLLIMFSSWAQDQTTLWVTILILTTSWKHCLCPCSFFSTTIGANAQTTEFSVLHLHWGEQDWPHTANQRTDADRLGELNLLLYLNESIQGPFREQCPCFLIKVHILINPSFPTSTVCNNNNLEKILIMHSNLINLIFIQNYKM